MRFLDSFSSFLSTLLLYFNIALHRITLFLFQTIEYRTLPVRPEGHRTILLLGDGTAEGVGDSPGHTGLSSRLNYLIRSQRDTSGLRLMWSVITCGKIFSTAAQWNPNMPPPRTSLFSRYIKTKPFRDAHVVVVLFGMHDDLNDEQLPTHIANIARGLALLGKHVLVATLPNWHALKDEKYAAVRRANAEIKRLVSMVGEEMKTNGVSVTCEVDPSKTVAMGTHCARKEDGFVRFNGNGYRLYAREVYEQVVYAAKRVEWAHWKKKLHS